MYVYIYIYISFGEKSSHPPKISSRLTMPSQTLDCDNVPHKLPKNVNVLPRQKRRRKEAHLFQ
jgi:hypothetical protein